MPTGRPSVSARAGTALNRRLCEALHGQHDRPYDPPHGLFDPTRGIYQGGGEASNFILQARRLVTIDMAIWEYLCDLVARIEMVDHVQNVVYVTDGASARAYGQEYAVGIGERWGVSVDAFDILNARGKVLFPRKLATPGLESVHDAPAEGVPPVSR